LEVGVEGEPDEKTGMVVDFARLKNIVQREVIIHLDHAYLNDLSVPIGQSSFPYNQPTAENIVAWIYNRLEHYWTTNNERGEIAFLRLWETSDSYVEERLR
jgi:6-pyruvoyltetrahydropterin/6-carboxytetrahydropterin synthase